MPKTVNDRVRKFRAKKGSTAKGLEEMRATNRLYKQRFRRKQVMSALSEKKTSLEKVLALSPEERKDLDSKTHSHKLVVLSKLAGSKEGKRQEQEGPDSKQSPLDEDDQQKVDVEVLQYEVKQLMQLGRDRGLDFSKPRAPPRPSRLSVIQREIKQLEKEREVIKNAMTPEEVDEVWNRVVGYKAGLLAEWRKVQGHQMRQSKLRDLELKVLRYEVKMMKAKRNDLFDVADVLLVLKKNENEIEF